MSQAEKTAKITNKRLSKPQHVKQLINDQINEIRKDETLSSQEKAKTIGYLSNILLKSLEMGDIAEKTEYIYKRLKEEEERNRGKRKR